MFAPMIPSFYRDLHVTVKTTVGKALTTFEKHNKLDSKMGQASKLMHLVCTNSNSKTFSEALKNKGLVVHFQVDALVNGAHLAHVIVACSPNPMIMMQALLQYESFKMKMDVVDSNGCSLLHYAVMRGDEQFVTMLLKHGCNAMAKDKEGNNCLHVACFAGNLPVAILLYKHFPHLAKDMNGKLQTPAQVAAEYKNYEVAHVLGISIPAELQLSLMPNKYALVIANSKYKNKPLLNVANDVTLICPLLQNRLNYHVTLVENTNTITDMEQAVNAFCKHVNASTTAPSSILFYFAGHGLEVNGKNLLVPISGIVNSMYASGYLMQDVFQSLITKVPTCIKLFFIDACRQPTEKFAPLDAEFQLQSTNCFIGLSTSPGTKAADGLPENNKYSPFAAAFANSFCHPQRSLMTAYAHVTHHVVMACKAADNDSPTKKKHEQVPWCQSSLTLQVFL